MGNKKPIRSQHSVIFFLQKYFLGLPRQNQLCKDQVEQFTFDQRTNIDSRGLKHLNMHSALRHRKK